MNAVWTEPAGRSRMPSSGASELRPSSPRMRWNGDSARAHRSHTVRPSPVSRRNSCTQKPTWMWL